MKVDIKKLPESQVEILIELDPSEWGKFVNEAAKEVGQEIKIDGFRPGMAPRPLVEQKVGLGHILEHAAELAVKENYVKAVKENKVEAIGRPEIQVLKVAEDNPFEFKAKVAVMPEVSLPDYQKIAKGLKKEKEEKISVEEKEINDSLSWLQKSRAKYLTVARSAQKGDRVEIDFLAKKDGQAFEGGESKNHPVIIGEGKFVPGFEDNLIGLKENEEKKFSLIFPEDFPQKDLAGQPVDFEAKMNLVQEAQLPEINDEFAKTMGKFADLTEMKKSISEGILMEKQQRAKEVWRARALQEVVKKTKMEIPKILVEAELEKMLQEFKANLAQMGLELEVYLKNIKKEETDLRRDWRDKAEERVGSALALRQLAEIEKIEVSEKEIEDEINKSLAGYPDIESLQRQIDMEELKEYTRGRLRNEKVFEKLENF